MENFVVLRGDLDKREALVRKTSIITIELISPPEEYHYGLAAEVIVCDLAGRRILLHFSDKDVAAWYVDNLINILDKE